MILLSLLLQRIRLFLDLDLDLLLYKIFTINLSLLFLALIIIIAEKSTYRSQAKPEKLMSFTNWLILSIITKLMLIKNGIWDLVFICLWSKYQNPNLFLKETKEDQIAVKIAWQIILKGVNDYIAFNIIDLKNQKEIWERLINIL